MKLTILDKYILKKYLTSFLGMFIIFIPISILASLAEKINKIIDNKAPFLEVLEYYGNFTLVLGNILMPILLFLSIIFFTTRLTERSEIVAMLSSGVSFNRFLRPYFIGATIVALLIFLMGSFIVPNASVQYHEFEYDYFHKGRNDRQTRNIFNQINNQDYVYVSFFDPNRNIGYYFTFEHFNEDQTLDYKITSTNIKWVPVDTIYSLTSYTKRKFREGKEIIEKKRQLDTLFNFTIDDLMPVSYIAETKNLFELNDFIDDQQRRGASNVNVYVLEKYKRWALPISAYILTVIAVSVASIKRRGGMGATLAFGMFIGFIYVFFERIFGVLAKQADFSPLMAILIPNVLFGILAFIMLQRAKR